MIFEITNNAQEIRCKWQ